jgi:two-component sensor histidine kinase
LAAAGWSLTLILTGSAFELARLRIEEDKVAATEALNTTQADIEWLSIQLEATNIDLAKYLHSILQTRLMSHALLLEQKPQNSQESVNELIEILSKPMSDFGQAVESIDKGLANLAREWQALIEVDLELVDLRSNDLASPTLLLVREAISNAVHHGLADKVWVRIKDQDSKRTIEVRDNGIGPTQNPAGMGTQTYESLSSNWSLTQASDVGSKLALELELR